MLREVEASKQVSAADRELAAQHEKQLGRAERTKLMDEIALIFKAFAQSREACRSLAEQPEATTSDNSAAKSLALCGEIDVVGIRHASVQGAQRKALDRLVEQFAPLLREARVKVPEGFQGRLLIARYRNYANREEMRT